MKRIRNASYPAVLAGLCIIILQPAAARAASATVQVWITDSATGLKVDDAHFVALAGTDTLVQAISGTDSPLSFQVDASAVDGEPSGLLPESAAVRAFPNPCRDRVSLDWVSAGPAGRIEIFDVLGRRLYAGTSAAVGPEHLGGIRAFRTAGRALSRTRGRRERRAHHRQISENGRFRVSSERGHPAARHADRGIQAVRSGPVGRNGRPPPGVYDENGEGHGRPSCLRYRVRRNDGLG
jgi:hypothetical protein